MLIKRQPRIPLQNLKMSDCEYIKNYGHLWNVNYFDGQGK